MAVLLTIYTPTYQRPIMLARCMASVDHLRRYTRHQVEQVVWYDEIGVGIAGMFAAIPSQLPRMRGQYVYVLQDDDQLPTARPHLIDELANFAAENNQPAVIICRNRKRQTVYPSTTSWRGTPAVGHIDLGNYIVRRDVFAAHAHDFGQRYEGDFDFINALWQAGHSFAWWDRLFAEEQVTGVPGLGRAEAEIRRQL